MCKASISKFVPRVYKATQILKNQPYEKLDHHYSQERLQKESALSLQERVNMMNKEGFKKYRLTQRKLSAYF